MKYQLMAITYNFIEQLQVTYYTRCNQCCQPLLAISEVI